MFLVKFLAYNNVKHKAIRLLLKRCKNEINPKI